MKRNRRGCTWYLLLFAWTLCAQAETRPRLAIIIDDLGYGLEQGRRVVGLPGPIACAILPDTPRARDLAVLANSRGKEVLLHLPLQSVGQADAPQPGGIGLDTSRDRFATLLGQHLDNIPHISGVSNHMGSLLTRHPGHMRWLMEEIALRERLFFVDSYTTKYSVATAVAADFAVPALRRDVFLDPEGGSEVVRREFDRALTLARRHGSALAIGHPYPATLSLLEERLPELDDAGIELVSLQDLIAARQARAQPAVPLVNPTARAID